MFNDGQSSYNSLQMKAQQRLARGFRFLAGYTFAKAMDDGKGEGSVVQDAYYRKGDRGRSDWDVTHRFVFSSTYELPFAGVRVWQEGLESLVRSWWKAGILTASSRFDRASVNTHPGDSAR